MYYLPQPPFLAAIAGLFIAVTCGTAFWNMMEQKLRDSYKDPQNKTSFKIDRIMDPALAFSYWSTCFGVWIFLGGGLQTFSFGVIPSYGVALLISIFTAGLVWDQINDVFTQLKEGGSEALSLEDIT
ncbi:hypothetical protein I4641_15295 [Waterburya agarophytonicola K14]|uniref:Uncharacterized protein n=1 Tax=Waterburya agarophytonicola KI4 TaxID=2874699 RepID=A0A964FGR2_9CYAN|nr:hypothetical protein [Waterburya agarophytonicola]MCC0178346.1 hypothetical protein [Waterburya agarophytonicola KI4]